MTRITPNTDHLIEISDTDIIDKAHQVIFFFFFKKMTTKTASSIDFVIV